VPGVTITIVTCPSSADDGSPAEGGAADALVGHRIAEASVHRLVADVANYLREHVK